MKNQNIVQAEFFHIGRDAPSFDAVLHECAERITDGTHIKTVVRFFDEGGMVTAFVLKLAKAKKQREAVVTAALKVTGVRRKLLCALSDFLIRRAAKIECKSKPLAVQQFKASSVKETVAVEQSDHSFRIARKDELHELLEAASGATGVWLFVFKPNDLLADSNTSVAYVM